MRDNNPLNILMLSMEYSPEISGGVGTHVQELSAGLSRHGDRVAVVACTVGEMQKLVENNRTVYLIPPEQGATSTSQSITWGILAFNRQLVGFVRQTVLSEWNTPDLVHCHNWLTFPAAYELGRSLKVPVICTIQFVSEPCERWWGQTPDPEIVEQETRACQEADGVITVSHSLRSILQHTRGIPDHKIHVIHNGMNVEAFSRKDISALHLNKLRAAVAPDGEKIVLFAGRLNPQKGVSAIFASMPSVFEHCQDVKYVFVGEPDSQQFANTLRQMLDESPALKARTMFLGKLPRDKLAALYRIADVALVPSVYEPFGYAAIEAMAAKVPLVATAAGGLAEIVDHGKTGISIPIHIEDNGLHSVDVATLAAATVQLLRDGEFARQLAAAGEEKARGTFGIETMVRSTHAIYEAVVSEFQPQHVLF